MEGSPTHQRAGILLRLLHYMEWNLVQTSLLKISQRLLNELTQVV